MGVSVEQWRAVIGRWYGKRGTKMKSLFVTTYSKIKDESGTCALFRLLLLLLPILLVIGCVETNPGPDPKNDAGSKQVTGSISTSSTFDIYKNTAIQKLKYPKLSGWASDKGQQFEFCIACLVAVRCLKQNIQFNLATNMDGIGAFDDLVLQCIDTDGKNRTYFIQLKYRDSLLKMSMFTTLKDKFCLYKYYLSYRKIKEMFENKNHLEENVKPVFSSEFSNCEFIICTTSKFDETFMQGRGLIPYPQNILNSETDDQFILSFSENLDSVVYDFYTDLLTCKDALQNLLDDLSQGHNYSNILQEWKKGLSGNIKEIVDKYLLVKDLPVKTKCQKDLCPIIEQYIKYIGFESDFKEFLSKLKIQTGTSCGPKLVTEIQNVIKDYLKLSDIDTEIISYYLKEKINEWWKSKYYLTSDWVEQFVETARKKVSLTSVEKLSQLQKLDLRSLEIGVEGDEITDLYSFVEKSGNLLIETDPYSKELVVLKLDYILKKLGKDDYVLMRLQDILNSTTEVLQIWKDVLVILNESVPVNVMDLCVSLSNELDLDRRRILIIVSERNSDLAVQIRNALKGNLKRTKDTCTLKQLDSSTQERLLTRNILFQGYEVPLKELLSGDETLKEKVNGENIMKLVINYDMITIGKDLPDVTDYFVPRTLERNICLSNSLFYFNFQETKFVFTGITEQELTALVPPDSVICTYKDVNAKPYIACECQFLILRSNAPEKSFQKLSKWYGNIHWIIKFEKSLIWHKSQGNVEIIYPHILPINIPYEIKTVMDIHDRFVLVSGPPGMGKSTLLTHLAAETKAKHPSIWVAHIVLRDWTAYLDKLKSQNIQISDIRKMFEECVGITSSSSPLENALFKHSLEKTGKIVVLLDSFDEISPDYSHIFQKLLVMLRNTLVEKIWVTSRPVMQINLLKELLTVPLIMRPFNERDKELCLVKFWRNKYPHIFASRSEISDLRCATKKFIKLFSGTGNNFISPGKRRNKSRIKFFVRNRDSGVFSFSLENSSLYWLPSRVSKMINVPSTRGTSDFMSIPLQTVMIGESVEEYVFSQKLKLPEKLNILQLYETFVEKKYLIFFTEKTKSDVTNPATRMLIEKHKKLLHKEHIKLALATLFSQDLLESLNLALVHIEDKELIENIGITYCIHDNIDNKPKFVHYTFVEYFAALWLAENYAHSELCRNILIKIAFEESFNFLRKMFDYVLCKGSDFHTAVLDNNIRKVERCLLDDVEVNCVDAGGRTALHLAAGYGLTQMSRLLLKNKADLYINDNVFHWKPLQYAKVGVLNKIILFQGYKVRLRALVSGGQDVSKFDVPEDLLHWLLVRSKVAIGSEHEDILHYYCHRAWSQELFGGNTFEHIDQNTVFALSGLEENVRQMVPCEEEISTVYEQASDNCRFFFLNSNNKRIEYENLCKKFRNVHWFHCINNEHCFHLQSQGNIKNLYFRKLGINLGNICPSSAFEFPGKVVLLIGEDGLGKSTYLTFLAKQSKNISRETWVIRLNLHKYSGCFNETNFETSDTVKVIKFILDMGNVERKFYSSKKQRFEELLFHFTLRYTNHVVLLVDGISELKKEYRKNAVALLKILKEMNFRQIWITGRPYMQKNLEKNFTCMSRKLEKHNISLLMSRYWIKCNKDTYNKYITVYSDIMEKYVFCFCSILKYSIEISMYAIMLADVLQNMCDDGFSQNEIQQHLNFLFVFEKYIQKRCKENTLIKEYKLRAIHQLFSSNLIQTENIEKIVEIDQRKPSLGHIVFTQYFAALWLSENYMENRSLLKKILFQPKFTLLRILFDYMLAKGSHIHIAVLEGDTKRIESLLSEGVDINMKDKGGRTALHLAVIDYVGIKFTYDKFGIKNCDSFDPNVDTERLQRANITTFLLCAMSGMRVDTCDSVLQWTPMQYAAKNRAWMCIEALKQYANIKLNIGKEDAYCALIEACHYNCKNILSFLIDNEIVNINEQLNSRKDTLLHIPLVASIVNSQFSDLEKLHYLIEKGADINLRNINGFTPLHLAVKGGYLYQIAKFLIDNGAELNVRTNSGHTPLHFAINIQIMKDLIAAGAEIDIADNKGYTPLHAAVCKSDLKRDLRGEMVLALIQAGANVNAQTHEGFTLLHFAVMNETRLEESVITEIVRAGALVNTNTAAGDTPLHLAVSNANLQTVRVVDLLINSGADYLKQNKAGLTPLHYILLYISTFRYQFENFVPDNRELKISLPSQFVFPPVVIPLNHLKELNNKYKAIVNMAISSGVKLHEELDIMKRYCEEHLLEKLFLSISF